MPGGRVLSRRLEEQVPALRQRLAAALEVEHRRRVLAPSSALRNASVNVRPRPRASPTARISLPRRGSASGNFAKSKRGAFTAT